MSRRTKIAILNVDHLLAQADYLAQSPEAGQPFQVDLRRAISSAYYAVFHLVTTAAADEFIRRANAASSAYGLLYRSIGHRQFKETCNDLAKPNPPPG